MCPVPVILLHAQLFNLIAQFAAAEDAQMPAGYLVVGGTEGPANSFRPAPRHGGAEQTTGFQHPVDFAQSRPVIGYVLQHFGANNLVEAVICEG